MIPVEYLWLALILVFGITGMVRGLWKELGVTTILLLSLFVLKFAWERVGSQIIGALPVQASTETVMALFYVITISFIAFISYEGITLRFPIQEMKGIGKALFGLPGGLLNGYLIIGTIWDAINQAAYLGLSVPLGSTGTMAPISEYLTSLHNMLAQYLPVTFLNDSIVL